MVFGPSGFLLRSENTQISSLTSSHRLTLSLVFARSVFVGGGQQVATVALNCDRFQFSFVYSDSVVRLKRIQGQSSYSESAVNVDGCHGNAQSQEEHKQQLRVGFLLVLDWVDHIRAVLESPAALVPGGASDQISHSGSTWVISSLGGGGGGGG